MCFSTTASFTAGTGLLAVSFYTIQTALTKNKKYLLLACMPMFFGIQQIFEGFVWLGLVENKPFLIKIATLAFLFFALAFWPAFSPLAIYFVEKKQEATKKILLLILFVIGLITGVTIYLSMIMSTKPLSTQIIYNSISYSGGCISPTFESIYTAIYVLVTILPFLIASNIRLKIFAIMIFFTSIISNYFYMDRRISVWCFFAAVLSLFIVYIMHKLPSSSHD